ncbi:MAG: biotin/lipoyl-binding protein [Caldilineaceae bacterium SB0670_bin_27]|uniref:Biotin/lipoyl-binding protein n=1 Tax=Caldilineaceae bacterium SB0664_bin_27 TaxID=2605260 RepID=A0A6B0YN36_9CHLR|nr:biotin/lipoyl-binding protein [Caldilineaceae bacterium]MDE0340496.1 biotin/lipoyl-binding protein [Caldilineaceae bacterium]MXY92413.1 biotin/lipoyl-binding protein [Caldilineaceae bacterium SB0664_bin_27]MYJ76716.1 biotin/lipoyl-binding protein [Caldilineaceae bacterium SB0670_bin_27]
MKYFASVGDHTFEIEINEDEVLVDGEAITVDLRQSGVTQLYSLLLDGASFEMLVEETPHSHDVTLRGEQFRVRIEDERTRRLNAARQGPALPQGDLAVRAPIPGMIVKILVQDGDEIIEDQPLMILEAMKMENEIRAVRSGVVRKVEVTAGESVEQDAVLIVIG